MKHMPRTALLALLSLAASSVTATFAQDYTIDWYTTDGGGVMLATGSDYKLSGTIGQPDAGEIMFGGNFDLAGGFWAGTAEDEFCCGDLDGDNDVDLADLQILLAHYGMMSGASYEDGDLDSDGDMDLGDLQALLALYGTLCP
jgi:hypothetical protein